MQLAQLIAQVAEAFAWPIVALIILFRYQGIFSGLIPGSKVKLTISGVTIERTLPEVEKMVSESLEEQITEEQWSLLRELRNKECFSPLDNEALVGVARPLRDAGLIRQPRGEFLQNSKRVRITALGQLLIDEKDKKLDEKDKK